MSQEEIRKKLDEKIPRDVISLRDGGGSKKLSYLEGWYVISRLNEVFGQGNWANDVIEMRLVYEGEGQRGFTCHYIAKIRLVVDFGDGLKTEFTDYGYGDGSDKMGPGKAHELAVKEAVTDGLKRCAKNLGMSMGLALYDKSQENVDDGDQEENRGSRNPTPSPRQPQARKTDTGRAEAKGPSSVASPDSPSPAPKENAPVEKTGGFSTPKTREETLELISSTYRVAVAKRVKTAEELKAYMNEKYSADKKEQLADAQATEFLTYLRSLI